MHAQQQLWYLVCKNVCVGVCVCVPVCRGSLQDRGARGNSSHARLYAGCGVHVHIMIMLVTLISLHHTVNNDVNNRYDVMFPFSATIIQDVGISRKIRPNQG